MGEFRQRETESHSAFSRSVEPEILPPDGGSGGGGGGGWYPPPDQQRYTQPPRPRGPKRQPPGWAFAPATYVLCGVNIAVYLAMFLSGVSFWDPTIRDLIHWGDNGTLVLGYGQWWRLITAMFVHVGIIHIATNIWCLWNLGLLAEPLMGPFGVAAAYLMTGFAGNLLSIAAHPGVPEDRMA